MLVRTLAGVDLAGVHQHQRTHPGNMIAPAVAVSLCPGQQGIHHIFFVKMRCKYLLAVKGIQAFQRRDVIGAEET